MKYAYQTYNKENQARAIAEALPISTKDSVEICNAIRKKNVKIAKKILKEAIEMKTPVAFRRFQNGAGHKRGRFSSAKYPVKACTHILKLLDSCEANGVNKGLTGELRIVSIIPNKASRPQRYGRHQGREVKRTRIEIVIDEVPGTRKKPKRTAEKKKIDVKKEKDSEEIKKEDGKDMKVQKEESKKKETLKPETRETVNKQDDVNKKDEKSEKKKEIIEKKNPQKKEEGKDIPKEEKKAEERIVETNAKEEEKK